MPRSAAFHSLFVERFVNGDERHPAESRGARPGTVARMPDTRPTSPIDYAALSAGWGALMGALLIAARDKGDEPLHAAEVLPIGLATFAVAKLVAKEKVDAWVREPFVEEHANGETTPKGTGLRYAVGELLTCTRCVGVWSAMGLVALRVTRPREARVVNAGLRRQRGQRLRAGRVHLARRALERRAGRRGRRRRRERQRRRPRRALRPAAVGAEPAGATGIEGSERGGDPQRPRSSAGARGRTSIT